jgi:hypothetical protein
VGEGACGMAMRFTAAAAPGRDIMLAKTSPMV